MFLLQYANKSTQTYFPAGLGPLTDETASLKDLKRKWQSRLGNYHKDVDQLIKQKFWSWEDRQIEFVEAQLTDLRETRGLLEKVLFKALEETHIKGVVPDESPAKRKRQMSC